MFNNEGNMSHDDLRHKAFFATWSLIHEHFWWPYMGFDIMWFLHTCYLCQLCQTKCILIPPTVATPAPLFAKVYMDTMDIICHWGTLLKIVTDNSKAFIKAMDHISKKYHIKHIHISSYNSPANSIVERSHYDIHKALFKAADSEQSKWSASFTGTHLLLPLDIIEATYLLLPPESILSTTEHIAH
ncbi:hypothetical protein BDQ12DRAFT_700648 [Crucibulum laeve]|uniref:Integrase zinc-binding domain-containing protein n=1 Tax=Crucibulum laeve TaxID=68775 RepID=A0A5C3LP31_9AGAR|nr:hypothetical protein BDQ12DRAFT_700648 [Crucibulum laeve]